VIKLQTALKNLIFTFYVLCTRRQLKRLSCTPVFMAVTFGMQCTIGYIKFHSCEVFRCIHTSTKSTY